MTYQLRRIHTGLYFLGPFEIELQPPKIWQVRDITGPRRHFDRLADAKDWARKEASKGKVTA